MPGADPAFRFSSVRVRTGVRLHYAEAGSPDGKPVLLLHGYSDSSFSFQPVAHLLADAWRLIVPDQRGHGDSDKPVDGYGPDDFAFDALALMDSLKLDHVTVAGHSLGSLTAQRMAALAPARIERLILAGSGATARKDALRDLVPVVQHLTDPVDRDFIREFQQSTIYRPVQPEFLERVVSESSKLPARVWKAALTGMLDLPETAEPGAIRCPTAIFWGDRDAIFTREDQDELLQRIPHAELHIFREVGHALHWEAPEEFARKFAAVMH